mmetsp:Transcript_26918/g.57667  ORF Transcript_26918/g.57667 Transcript_26918/m.57667 type:complete len:259 (-) Transcript_26918:74-850(-)
MQTQTKVVNAGSWKASLTLLMTTRVSSNRPTIASCVAPGLFPPPIMAVACPINPPNRSLSSMTLPKAFSRIVGKDNKRRVCPVGAVSKTTTSKSRFCTCFINSEKDIASSIPGILFVSSDIMDERPPSFSSSAPCSAIVLCISSISLLASISMALRLSNPSIGVGSRPIFWQKASLKLWAGSVDTIRTFFRVLANWTPKQQLVVVLPTPPLPPTKTHWRLFWSMIFFSEGSGRSVSSMSSMLLMLDNRFVTTSKRFGR